MKTLTNSKINRWKQLIEYDIEKLELHLDNITSKPLFDPDANTDVSKIRDRYDKTNYRYDLAPSSEESIKRQIEEDREVLDMLNDEIGRMTFTFGFAGASSNKIEVAKDPTDTSLIKGIK